MKILGWSLEKATTTPKKQYNGFSYDKRRRKYIVSIKENGKTKFIGRYDTEKEAIEARSNYINN